MSPISRRVALLCLGLVLTLPLTLGACGQPEPVRLAALMPLSGPAAYAGRHLRDGLEMAIAEVNERGGLNGRPLEMTVIDSAAGAGPAEAYAELVATDPLLVIAGTSSVAMALKPLAEADRRLLIGLVATAPELTAGAAWTYRYWPLAETEVPPMVGALPPDDPLSVGVAFLDDAYGRSVAEGLAAHVRDRGGRVELVPFALGTTDFAPVAERLKETDAIAMAAFDSLIRRLLEALAATDYQGRRLATTSAALPIMFGQPAAEGLYVAAPAIYNPNFTIAERTRQAYEARTAEAFNQYAANGIDFIRLLVGLLEDREVSAVSLKARLADGFAYAGLFGNVGLKAGSHDIEFPLLPARIEAGRLVYR